LNSSQFTVHGSLFAGYRWWFAVSRQRITGGALLAAPESNLQANRGIELS
jgi:hypothetical protein